MAKIPEYITLSHRWTDATKTTQLTWSNLANFTSCIQTSRWPSTFKDAISIAQQLEIHYIWIDSICIIQDEKESLETQDWDGQSDLMHHVYANGALNLAGIEGQRCDGLSVPRNPQRATPCILSSKVAGAPNSPPSYWICWRPDDIVTAVDKAPLSERAWVFWERVLSKRTVHFGNQLYWECGCVRACEFFPVTMDHPMHPEFLDDFIRRLKLKIQQPREQEHARAPCDLHQLWSSIVRF